MSDDENQNDERPGRPPGVFDQTFLTGVEDVTEVLLVRHGQQDSDFSGPMSHLIDPPLSVHGQQQAKLLGAALSTMKIDGVFSSTLRRAGETAQRIAGHHRDIKVEIVDDLREVEVFRDIPLDKTAVEFLGRDLLEAVRLRMLNERSWDVYPHSEPSFDFRKRAINAIETIIARNVGERIVIVCHGGVINAYIGHIIRSSYDMFFRPAHTSVNIVVVGHNRRVLRTLNDTHHLRTGEGDFLTY